MHNVIAAHKQVEATLRHLAMIAEQAGEGIAVVGLDGALRFFNRAWARMHGYKARNELVGKQIGVFHTKEQMKTDVIPFIEETKRRGQLEGLVEHIRSNGTPFPTQMKMTIVKDEADKAIGLIVFATDITQRKQLEDMLRENTRRTEKLKEQIGQLQNLFSECRQVEESLTEQTDKLNSDSEKLQQQITELNQSQERSKPHGEQPARQKAELTDTNEQLQHDNIERDQSEDVPVESSEQGSRSERHRKPLNTKELGKLAELGKRLSGRC
jgi:PAS domain S-box-containing protein